MTEYFLLCIFISLLVISYRLSRIADALDRAYPKSDNESGKSS